VARDRRACGLVALASDRAPVEEVNMESAIRIRPLTAFGEHEVAGLSEVLIDCVEGGASVSFMHPMTRAKAEVFWRAIAASVDRGERVVLAAEDDDGSIVGTVQVIWAEPENQAHRGDLAKMLVHRRARRRGIGEALLEAAERAAADTGRTLLVLDTASDDAERLYARRGWERCGVIPDYALLPDGEPCATTIFFKRLSRR
jgi:GNAT superfamily N-acetyltransferase